MVQINQALNVAANLLNRAVEGLGEQIGEKANAVVRQFSQQQTAASRGATNPRPIDLALGEGRLRQTLDHTPSIKAKAHQALADATNSIVGKLGLQGKLGSHLPSGSRFIQLERSAQKALQLLDGIDKRSESAALRATSAAISQFRKDLIEYAGPNNSDTGLLDDIQALDSQLTHLDTQRSAVNQPVLQELGINVIHEVRQNGNDSATLFRGKDTVVRPYFRRDLSEAFASAVGNHYERIKSGGEPAGVVAELLDDIGVSLDPQLRAAKVKELPIELRERLAMVDAVVRDFYSRSGKSSEEIDSIAHNAVTSAVFLRGIAPALVAPETAKANGFDIAVDIDSSQLGVSKFSSTILQSLANGMPPQDMERKAVYETLDSTGYVDSIREFVKDIVGSVTIDPQRVERAKQTVALDAGWPGVLDFSEGRSSAVNMVQSAYREMLVNHYAEENFDFLVAVSEFREMPSYETAQMIINAFVDNGAKRQVNLKYDVQDNILRGLVNPVPEDLFDNAYGAVEKLLNSQYDKGKLASWLGDV